MRYLALLLLAATINFISFTTQAESKIGYYGFEPEIVTNYISPSRKKLGYVRVSVKLMLEDIGNMEVVEHHTPLLKDAIVAILSKEPEEQIKSLVGRNNIRQKCTTEVKRLLKQETGQEIIKDLLFTKYLYN